MKKYLGLSGLQDVIKKIRDLITSVENNLNSHTLNKSNPHEVTKEQIGLSNVENKSSATIRSELTKENIVDGLGYTPIQTQYTHPSSHPASIIEQDATHRFVSDTEKSNWNSKANAKHTHTSTDITSLEANKITGIINIENLPQGALERCIPVENDTERFKLTTSTVQKGDTVKVVSSGKMYFVVDDTKLSTEEGYEIYTAGSATSVPWSGVTGKPSTFPPSTHKHEIADVNGLSNELSNKATSAQGVKADSAVQSVKLGGVEKKTGTIVELPPYPTTLPASDVSAWAKASSKPTYTKSEIGLGNVENKSSATIRSELTKENVTTALGYTPPTQDTKYTHPSYTAKTNGLYKVTVDSTGHISAVASVTKADITALGIPGQDTNTTYGVATQSTNGLLSSTDKTKLDGIATGANKYVLPTASSSTLGGVKTTSSVTSASGYTACPIISGVPYYKDTNTTYSLGSFGITATAAELNYTDGVTSNIQTQLNGKAASSHTHSQYAASSHTHTKAQISDFPSSLPANGGTATNANNVAQTAVDASGYTNWRTLVWGASSSGTEGFTPTTTTGQLFTSKTISCQPSSGTIKASVFKGSLSGNASSASSVPWSGVSGRPSSMPASDVYSWAKASTKPSYSWGEITGKPTTFTPAAHNQAWSTITGKPSTFTPAAHSHHVAQSSEPSGQNNGDLWFKTI